MKLEEIVPPLDLCKKIPEGCFAESALVWITDFVGGKPIAEPRRYAPYDHIAAPAPTLAEILDAIDKTGCSFSLTECDERFRTRDALAAWGEFTGWGEML